MKNLILLFLLSSSFILPTKAGLLSLSPVSYNYYALYSVDATGSVTVCNAPPAVKVVFEFRTCNMGKITTKYVQTKSNGEIIYQGGDNTVQYTYVISSDHKHMAQVMYMLGDWFSTTWFTTDKNEQMAFYKNNKQHQTNGVRFANSYSISTSQSSTSSQTSSSAYTTCKVCGGTGVCQSCHGQGGEWRDTGYYTGSNSKSWISCPSCNGNKRCYMCHGTGRY